MKVNYELRRSPSYFEVTSRFKTHKPMVPYGSKLKERATTDTAVKQNINDGRSAQSTTSSSDGVHETNGEYADER